MGIETLYFSVREKNLVDVRLERRWILPRSLFGDVGTDFYDFMEGNYVYFLDNCSSRWSLIKGLRYLSPFADDALKVARGMNRENFSEFRKILPHERRASRNMGCGLMPDRYNPLLVPRRFIWATPLASTYDVPLGTVLIRLATLFRKDDSR